MRRSGGPAALLTLCVLYAILARRIGIPLQIVTLQPPSTAASANSSAASSAAATHSASAAASAPSHQYLLRLPPQVEQEELYIDVLAQGRLRGAHDVAELATRAPHAGADSGDGGANSGANGLVHELAPEGLCTRLLTQLMMSCDAAEDTHEVPDPHAHPKPNRNLSLGMPEAPPTPTPPHPHPQALFWQMQLEVLQGQLTIAKEELERPT